MPNIVIVGAQWGDEGKGKIVDCLTETSDVVARYQGGHNAGHTVVIGNEKFILHLLPSGILHKEKLCIIGNGLVVELSALVEEIEALRARGVVVGSNLKVSKAAHLIMPYHVALDQLRESARGDKKIGTTGRGIGPAYTDKAARTGIRVSDLFYPDVLREKLQSNLIEKNLLIEKLYGGTPISLDEAYDTAMSFRDKVESFVDDTDVTINRYISQGKSILFEGAQGTMLDIDHGTYHCVTSSSACAGGALTGLGVGPKVIDEVLGVAKAYTTRVGGGPFPTELEDATGEMLRKHGGEYGATTGRPRRCGWLDLVVLRHAVRVNGLTGLVITKLDVLDGLDSVSVCVGYRYGGKVFTEFPKEMTILEQCQPVYEQFDGWSGTAGVRDFQKLPSNARSYLKMIEERLNVPIAIVSTGQDREDTIFLKGLR
ncbi:adenylosuccinate synthetase [Candidatus Magnetobacterium bavaricum]|uniref:Adenylosuccinate synthetase n=1 Tax=Candidatus Magnetobacterium bavaricum TaxID=29290 RepID=A0A0F3GWE2_9BACT|nr:adenylosuccinate synthetase [Candidatus Magnetobacterium bavaricum]